MVMILTTGLLAAHLSGRWYKQEMQLKTFMTDRVVLDWFAKRYNPKEPTKLAPGVASLANEQKYLQDQLDKQKKADAERNEELSGLAKEVGKIGDRFNNREQSISELKLGLNELQKRLDGLSSKSLKDVKNEIQPLQRQLQDFERRISRELAKVKEANDPDKKARDLARMGESYKRLARVYADMDADTIAEIFQDKTLKETQVVELMTRLPKDKVSEVLSAMDAQTAAAYTRLLAERN